jgi:diaminopimelate decarboxylase
MEHFQYKNGVLHCEDVAVSDLASRYGTPLYVYSQAALLHQLCQVQKAFVAVDPLICYSIKSNANLHLCRLMVEHGAGVDVTSGGELYRALKAGAHPDKIVFAGAGKTEAEHRAGLEAGVLMFNVESEEELLCLGDAARSLGKIASVALRVNPDLPPKTHAKTDTSVKGVKFGLDIDTILETADKVVDHPHLRIVGLHMHLGSPILKTEPYKQGIDKGLALIDKLRAQGHAIAYLNMGGGFGISYRQREELPASAFAEVIVPGVKAAHCKLILEPGRFIMGNAGILLSRVIYTKESGSKHFIIQDGAMNDLIRPTLYDSFHRIWPVAPGSDFSVPPDDFESEIPGTLVQDVVGPVCESGDFLARNRRLPRVKRGDLLATFSAGAYGMAMSSNYNGRTRAAEVLVNGNSHRLVRRRETYEDLVRPELEA